MKQFPLKQKFFKTLHQYFDGLVALIYPYFCVVCGDELNQHSEHFCFMCDQELHYTYFEKYEGDTSAEQVFWGRLKIENVYALLYYEEGTSTRKILHHIKYNEGKELGRFMGRRMGEKLKDNPKFSTLDAVIPIPVHSKKEFLRGYNQSLLIAQGVSEAIGVPVVEALYRKAHDQSQTKKSKEERYKNVKGKFALKENGLKGCRHVLIVDDVLTTGSTLEFASRTIYEGVEDMKVSLGVLAMAH